MKFLILLALLASSQEEAEEYDGLRTTECSCHPAATSQS